MAKDPAMLWYWNDWHSSTVLLSRFLKGCFMDVMHAQFNNGRLSLEEIKVCLGSDFGTSWPAIQKKFKQDENGLFFNERLEHEKEKRRAFTESRRQNVSKKEKKPSYDDTYVKHMNNHMENENRNDNSVLIKKSVENSFPTMPLPSDAGDLPDIKINSCIELLKITKQVTVEFAQVQKLWPVFLAQNVNGTKYYANVEAIHSHFINWIKTQHFGDSKTKLGTSAARIEAARNF